MALLTAAAEVFVECGYESSSLDDIAAKAGFTRGAIYSSFDNKEDLFLAVVTGINERWISTFEVAFRHNDDGAEPMSESIAALWAALASSGEQQSRLMLEFRVVALRNQGVARRLAEFEKRMEETMSAIVQDHIDSGLLRSRVPANELAVLMYAASQGILLHELACDVSHPELFGNLIAAALRP